MCQNPETESSIAHIKTELYGIKSRMSVFVGSGFSKNAHSDMPLWKDLKQVFEEHLGIQNGSIYSAAELADSIQTKYGRPVLNRLIEKRLTMMQPVSIELHAKLLTLPWHDVLTTNYDQFLENAAYEKAEYIAYQTIRSQADLLGSASPRIIKLHGCVTNHNYTISTEDYRTFADRQSGFSNTVQQVLLETSCCLIGFSADDPNFEKWFGWVRDTFARTHTHKLFYIDVDGSLDETKKMSLHNRNITVIDYSNICYGNSIEKRLESLLGKLSNKPPQYSSSNRIPLILDSNTELSKFSIELSKFRDSYAGWRVLPVDYRNSFFALTLSRTLEKLHANLPESFAIDLSHEFLSHLCWALNLCLLPLSENIAYRLLKTLHTTMCEVQDKSTASNTSGASQHQPFINSSTYLPIVSALLRHFRIKQRRDDFESTLGFIDYFKLQDSSIEFKHIVYCEKLSFELYALNTVAFMKKLDDWPTRTTPYWQTRRAMFYAYFGQNDTAETILHDALLTIRQVLSQNNLNSGETHHGLLQDEAIVIHCLLNVTNATTFATNKRGLYNTLRDSNNSRELDLRRFRIDIYNELAIFDAQLRDEKYVNTAKVRGISPGDVYDEDGFLKSYEYLQFLEVIGLSLPIPHYSHRQPTLKVAWYHLRENLPHYSFVHALLNNNSTDVTLTVTTQYLFNLTQHVANGLVGNMLDSLQKAPSTQISDLRIRPPFIFPVVLAVLFGKASELQRKRVIEFLQSISSAPHKNIYTNIDDLLLQVLKNANPSEIPQLADLLTSEGLYELVQMLPILNAHLIPATWFLAATQDPAVVGSIHLSKEKLSDLIHLSQLSGSNRVDWYSVLVMRIIADDSFSAATRAELISLLPAATPDSLPLRIISLANYVRFADQFKLTRQDSLDFVLAELKRSAESAAHTDIIGFEYYYVLNTLSTEESDLALLTAVFLDFTNFFLKAVSSDQSRDLSMSINSLVNTMRYSLVYIIFPRYLTLPEAAREPVTKIIGWYKSNLETNAGPLFIIYDNLGNPDAILEDALDKSLTVISEAVEAQETIFLSCLFIFASDIKNWQPLHSYLIRSVVASLKASRIQVSVGWMKLAKNLLKSSKYRDNVDIFNFITTILLCVKTQLFENTTSIETHEFSDHNLDLLFGASELAKSAFLYFKDSQSTIAECVQFWGNRGLENLETYPGYAYEVALWKGSH